MGISPFPPPRMTPWVYDVTGGVSWVNLYKSWSAGVCVCSPAHHFSLNYVQDGTTALFVAAQNGHLRVVEVLIAAKAQVDIQQKVRFNTTLVLYFISINPLSLYICF